MTLDHIHPRAFTSENGKNLFEDVSGWCSAPATSLTSLADVNFTSVLRRIRSHGTSKTPAQRGRIFEWIIYDLCARVAEEMGFDPLEVIETNVDMVQGKHTEADLLIGGKLAVLVKTSYRERWKQIDRDAMGMGLFQGNKGLSIWSLFYGEHDDDELSVVRRKAGTVQSQCYAPVEVRSIKDHDRMDDFLQAVRRALDPSNDADLRA